jgi:coatomer subunit beta'
VYDITSFLLSVHSMQVNPKAAESLADPAEYPNLFEDWQVALTVEQNVASQR